MNIDKLGARRMDGNAAGIDTNAGMVAPADTQAANQGIHFDDHGMIKASVEEKVGMVACNGTEMSKAKLMPAVCMLQCAPTAKWCRMTAGVPAACSQAASNSAWQVRRPCHSRRQARHRGAA
jgi:hypothetical protein